MTRYLLLLVIIPFLTSCGGGGGGAGGGNNDTGNKINTACSSDGKIARVKINEDGIYRLAYSDLYNTCPELSGIDPATIMMTNQGKEIAVEVVDNNVKGRFDSGDYIEFYAKAIQRDDGRFRFTETNVYWLSVEGGNRKRIREIAGNPQAGQGTSSFPRVLHREEDTWYEQKNYPEVKSSTDVREHWFWGEVFYAGDKRDYNFNTRYFDNTKPVSLKLRLQSVSGSHHIRGYINPPGNLVIDKIWSGQEPFELEVSIPVTNLNNGSNVLRLESIGDTSSGIFDLFYVDWFEVTYYHTYQAEHNVLEFNGEGLIDLTNFTSSDISLYDISDHLNVKKIAPVRIEETSSGYKAIVSIQGNPEGKFLALAAEEKKTPLALEAYTTDNIRSKNADYVIITYKDFYDAIKTLADHRKGLGYTVLIVKVGDIYDEFSDGIETPQAIKDFLKYAYDNWATRPKYVLLVGDATVDYKDILGYGVKNGVKSYVPAYPYNYPGLGEVPSDNWFVDVDDKNGILPEMNIGRIPAKSPSEVSAVVTKIIKHESSSRSNNVLLVADDDLPVFEELSESIAAIIPDTYSVSRLYQKSYPDDFRSRIISAIDSGTLILNYTGHGSVVDWTKDDVFTSKDVGTLKNEEYPFVVALNCLNGYFMLPDEQPSPSIAETFLLSPDKGAVAVWAASAIGYPSEHDPLAQALYNVVFKEDVTVLGDAVSRAKEVAYETGVPEDAIETFIFFGDPATRLK